MKKKIINGFLMVALVAATSTSFVSCKDTSEDVKTDLMAQVNAVKANLEPRVEQAEKDIDALEKRADALEDSVSTHRTELNGLRSDVNDLKTRVGNLEDDVDSLEDVTKKLEYRMDTVENRIATIVESLRKMVTSVTVNATSTSILQNSKIFPGINMQFLGATYGKATTTGKFPSTTTLFGHGTALKAEDFEGVEIYSWKNGEILPKADEDTELADAGTIWFTLNPSNVDVENLTALKLVDSQNNESFVTIKKSDAVVDNETVLDWSVTRADGDTFKPVLWKAQAGIDLEATDLATIDPTKIIDYKSIANDVREMLKEAKNTAYTANRSNYEEVAKTTTKGILKSSAQIVASLLNAKLPSLPALALEAQWKDTVGTRSVLSDYSIAATAYKPLTFDFGKDLIPAGEYVSLQKLNNQVARILNNIKNKVNSIGINNITIANINLDANDLAKFNKSFKLAVYQSATYDIYVTTVATTVNPDATKTIDGVNYTLKSTNIDANMENAVTSLLDEVNGSLNSANTDIQAVIDNIKSLQADVTKYADKAQSFETRVVNFLERELNRVVSKVSTDGLTRVLEPVILFQAGDNYSVTRFYEGTQLPAGKITLVPTTLTYELLAPAFKKYVAIKNNTTGKFEFQKVLTKGEKNFKQIETTLAAGDYTIIYSALDFYGVQISKKYDFTVK